MVVENHTVSLALNDQYFEVAAVGDVRGARVAEPRPCFIPGLKSPGARRGPRP